MITLIKADGTIVLTEPTRVYQGSNKTSQIILFGAVAQNLMPQIAFKLPQSGEFTSFDIMTSANIPTNEGISAWTYEIPLAITQEYGQVDFQITIEDIEGQTVASGMCSFEVERGVPPDTSNIPDLDIYQTIKQNIQSIQADILNSWFSAKSILPYDPAFSYPKNALTYEGIILYKSLIDNNQSNELTDSTKWEAILNLNDLENRTTTNEQEIVLLKNTTQNQEQSITLLESEIEGIEKNTETLQTQVNNLNDVTLKTIPQTFTDSEKRQIYDNLGITPGGQIQDSYTELSNKPSINGVTLLGDKDSSQFGLVSSQDIVEIQRDIYRIGEDIANLESLTNEIENGISDLNNKTENVAKTNTNNNFTQVQTFNGDITVNGNITQNGSTYETHAEQVYTKNDVIITREGATGALGANQYTGIKAQKYDGTNNGLLVFGADGVARVGDEGDTQPLATREEMPVANGYAYWNNADKQFNTKLINQAVVIASPSSATNGTLTSEQLGILQADKSNYIIFNGEKYAYADDHSEEGFLVYSHSGLDATYKFYVKCIAITLSTRGWVLRSLPLIAYDEETDTFII